MSQIETQQVIAGAMPKAPAGMSSAASPGRTADAMVNAIHKSLKRRRMRPGTIARSAEDIVKRGGAYAWIELKRRPFFGVAVAGVGGVMLATAVGVPELAVGAALAYGAFGLLVRGESPERVAADLAKELEEF